MILIGAVLLLPPLQLRVALIGGPISDWVDQSFGGFSKSELGGQFGVGLLLGAAWRPLRRTNTWCSICFCGTR
ncbi:MAG: cytochrome biosis protein [Bradyrhizobium sp.]|nr:cytochrome biosis protein [Bradyrhizobium sp.]